MSCLTATRKAELIAQRDALIASIAILSQAITNGAATAHITSYEIDTGAGKQKVTYKNINEVIRAEKTLQAQLDRINTILEGKGVVDMDLRRKALGNNRYY
jgi:hypothetical protein